MSPRITALLVLAALALGGGAAAALAATADSISVEVSNSKSLRRLALFADISECDGAGGYGCYTSSYSIYSKTGKRILKRSFKFSSGGKAAVRYPWSCKYTGRLKWRVNVSDGSSSSKRSGGFKVQSC
jgi:hypothetical protein